MLVRVSIFSLLLLSASCSNNSSEIQAKSGETASAISAGSMTEAELEESLRKIKLEEEKKLAEEIAKSTTMEFDKLKHDFGDVLPDSDNTTEFIVYNTGDKPLILEDVSASCGCTMPKKPEAPILPGESDVIEVTFHPKPGQVNEIKKTITVTANTVEKVHMLEIRAFVTK